MKVILCDYLLLFIAFASFCFIAGALLKLHIRNECKRKGSIFSLFWFTDNQRSWPEDESHFKDFSNHITLGLIALAFLIALAYLSYHSLTA